jgi:hypothetical protein
LGLLLGGIGWKVEGRSSFVFSYLLGGRRRGAVDGRCAAVAGRGAFVHSIYEWVGCGVVEGMERVERGR